MKRQLIYQGLGFVFVVLGAIGVLLPLLPTTPFLILAAACFARSSEKWHAWLLRNRIFGPMVKDWETKRCINRRVQLVAIASIVIIGGYSIGYVISDLWLQVFGSFLLIVGLTVVLRIPVCDKS